MVLCVIDFSLLVNCCLFFLLVLVIWICIFILGVKLNGVVLKFGLGFFGGIFFNDRLFNFLRFGDILFRDFILLVILVILLDILDLWFFRFKIYFFMVLIL